MDKLDSLSDLSSSAANSRLSMSIKPLLTGTLSVGLTPGSQENIVSTGMNPIYTDVDGKKVFSEEYKNRYMNDKVENELVDFKVEIHEKFEASKMNATYVFKRSKDLRRKKKGSESFDVKAVQPSYTFNEKILLKNYNNYEKAISGDNDAIRINNEYMKEMNTYELRMNQDDLAKHDQSHTFYSEKYDVSTANYKPFDIAGKHVWTFSSLQVLLFRW